MSNALPVDVTMDCFKCKKAILKRVFQKFQSTLLYRAAPSPDTIMADLGRIIKEELAR